MADKKTVTLAMLWHGTAKRGDAVAVPGETGKWIVTKANPRRTRPGFQAIEVRRTEGGGTCCICGNHLRTDEIEPGLLPERHIACHQRRALQADTTNARGNFPQRNEP